MSSPDANAVVLMDRFVSASSPQDAVESLRSIVKGLKSGDWQHDWIFEHGELLDALLQLLQHGTLGNNNVECEDGVPLVCQIFLELKDHTLILQKPSPGRLLEALLDVMESGQNVDNQGAAGPPKSAYTRVLALQVLEGISKANISKASTQWLQAPNGLHRLADLIDNDTEEVVRNQALLVLRILATQAPMAKVFLFAELDVKLLDFCWYIGGGLTKGSTMVLDALELICELMQHADSSLQDLVWQRPTVAPRLAQLLDLRGGDEFLHPPKKPKSAKSQDDDLDDLLNGGSGASSKQNANRDTKKQDSPPPIIPRLLPAEEKVVQIVLNILNKLLDSESVRPAVWKQHFGLCSLVWELALMGPPIQPPVCSRPSPQLQQAALELVAQKFNDPVLMDRHGGLDRLLYLVVTGGTQAGSAEGDEMDQKQTSSAALGISQAALAVLRNTLDAPRIHELLLHTLAPPPIDENDTDAKSSSGPTVVQKLWNTVAQNLNDSVDADDISEQHKTETTSTIGGNKNRSLFLSGALGGLALLLKTEESREMMFKAMTITMDQFLKTLENEKDPMVQWTLSRFLCEWIFQSPLLVQSLLGSTMSTHLAEMASAQGKSNPLLYLLLGLAMDAMSDSTAQCGGWTRDGILQVLQSAGIAKITTRLESLKKKTTEFPWSECALEFKHWETWYQKAVWIVRKRIVEELARTSSNGDSSDEEEEAVGEAAKITIPSSESAPATPNKAQTKSGSSKTLQKLLNQQSKEMEELRQSLEEAQAKIKVQESQLETWKRRMESTPTELDTMLNEVTTKNTELEETIEKMQAEAKQIQAQHAADLKQREDALEEQRQEAERLRNEEHEAREDRDRMEQELQGLSQAYASLEEEFRQQTASSASGAPTGENGDQPRQSQGENSQQTATVTSAPGSTEIATLREEINRLRSENGQLRDNAMEADNWMNMAVQRMNDMGAQNSNLEQNVKALQEQLEQIKVQPKEDQSDGQTPEQIEATEIQLQQEVTLRQAAEAQLANATGEIETQKQQVADTKHQLAMIQEELQGEVDKARSYAAELEGKLEETKAQLINVQSDVGFEKQLSEVQQQLSNLRDESQTTIEKLKTEIFELQGQLNEAQKTSEIDAEGVQDETAQAWREELESKIASKDIEIQALQSALKQAQKTADEQQRVEVPTILSGDETSKDIEYFQQELSAAKREAEEINRRSQEEIYKKEARIRELEDRLNNGLGEYKIEDIRLRDEEIEELRSANEAAQEWMAKAVEHHQLLSNQVRALTDEKVAMANQLKEFDTRKSDASEAALKLFENQLQQTTAELDETKSKLMAQTQALSSLQDSNSSLEQDLEIARDDLGNLQRQLDLSQDTIRSLESRLAENRLASENEELRESNKDLNSRLEEFQAWADMAQTKIAGILADKDSAEARLKEAKERLQAKETKIVELEKELESKPTDSSMDLLRSHDTESDIINDLRSKLNVLESANRDLSADCESQKSKLAKLQIKYTELQTLEETARQRVLQFPDENASLPFRQENSGSGEVPGGDITKLCNEAKCEYCDMTNKKYVELEVSYKEMQTRTEDAQEKIKQLLESRDLLERSLASSEDEAGRVKEEILRLREKLPAAGSEGMTMRHQQQKEERGLVNTAEEFFGSQNDVIETSDAATFFGAERDPAKTNAQDFFGPSDGNKVEDVVVVLQQMLKEKDEDVKLLREKLACEESSVKSWEERVTGLENELKALQEQSNEREDEARSAIVQRQEACAKSDKKCSELAAKLEAAETEIKNLKDALENSKHEHEDIESSTRELDEKIASLEHAIDEEMDDLHREQSDSAEGEAVEDLSRELKLVQESLDQDDIIVAQWEERVAELEATVASLRIQLQDQEDEANGAISQWQESYNEVEKRCTQLETELEESKTANLAAAIDGEKDVSGACDSEGDSKNLVFRIQQLETELKEAKDTLAADEDVVKQWEERVSELESQVMSLESQLEEQEREANEAISKWQENASNFEESCLKMEEEVSRLEEEKTRFQASISDADVDRSPLNTRVAELKANPANIEPTTFYHAGDSELVEKLASVELELREAKETLARDEEIVQQWDERCSSLEAQIRTLVEQLVEQEDEAKAVVQQWQDSYTELEEKLSSLEKSEPFEDPAGNDDSWQAQLREKDSQLSSALETIRRDEEVVQQWEDRVAELEKRVFDLQSQLEEQEREAEAAISSWQEKYSELEEQCSELEIQVSMSENELASKTALVQSLQTQLLGHTSNDERIQSILLAKEELESSLAKYKAENERLGKIVDAEREASRIEKEKLEGDLAGEKGRHAEARDEIEELTKALEQVRDESEEVVNQWTERVDELTCTVQDLEVQLQEQEADANEAISSWEKKVEDLEAELETVTEVLAALKAELGIEEDSMVLSEFEAVVRTRDDAQEELHRAKVVLKASNEEETSLIKQISELQQHLEAEKTKGETSVAEKKEFSALRSALEEQLKEAENRYEYLSRSNDDLKKSKESIEVSLKTLEESEEVLKNELSNMEKELVHVKEDRARLREMLASKSHEKLEEERDRLAIVVTKLEEELREANEMVQAYITDGLSKEATEVAAQALRDEIEHLRRQVDEYRAAAESEKAAREASDLEIERLREDIGALIALGDEGLDSDDIQILTTKASEKLKSKERQEIQQLRKSLFRAIDELELARAAEKEANEKLSKARLQNSVCEQEIVAAKSEIMFLTQALEDMRQAEEGKRASLEYHINSLEDENDVLRKYNNDELEAVRSELAQVSMEKDRILHQLKESEKANAAFVLSGAKGGDDDSEERNEAYDLEAEVAKLKAENSYLLTVSANDKARAERRLREMLGAQAAAAEADTILEHELRIAAEATIQTLKIEIEQLKSCEKEESKSRNTSSRNKGSSGVYGLADEVDSLKKEIQKLKKENTSLKSRLEQEASVAREKMESLTDECRQAQAKLHKFERQGRFDAAVKSEIARSRMSPGMATPERRTASQDDWMLVSNDPAMDRNNGIMTSAEAFDLIRKQKDEIQEERQMYLEFLSEHEDLLALLAQHDIERACLKNLITTKLGEDAVDEALREAEEKSRSKFGQVIRAS